MQNINRSAAVDNFKDHGSLRYQSAQKFPIDVYKDVILLHDFLDDIYFFTQRENVNAPVLKKFISDRYQSYRKKNVNHAQYGGLIEMLYRRKVSPVHIKSYFQSVLLNTKHISYQTYDEVKAYIVGIAEAPALMVAEIIGFAPPLTPYAHALGEGLRLLHMLVDLHLDVPRGRLYIPQSQLKQYNITYDDIRVCIKNRRVTHQGLIELIQYYLQQHTTLCTYALGGIGYLNSHGTQGILREIDDYEHIVDKITQYNYNIFHPYFITGFGPKVRGYLSYIGSGILGKK